MKVLKAVLTIASVLAIMMGGSLVFAQERPKPKMKCQKRFIKLDADKDGKVTLQEFMARIKKHPGGKAEEVFKMRDANADGVLSKEEFCSGRRQGKSKI